MRLEEIRDRGSRRLLGYGPKNFRIFSDPVDVFVLPPSEDEDRNDLIRAMVTYEKLNVATINNEGYFDISRQRIHQIVNDRTGDSGKFKNPRHEIVYQQDTLF